MLSSRKSITILVADDDEDDRKMLREAFAEAKMANPLYFVEDGVEVFDYLYHRGKFSDPQTSPWPGILLLDLNMPRKDGREVLKELHDSEKGHGIRVIVMTTSKAEEDIVAAYASCAASFITKPVTFETLVEVIRAIGHYWLEIVEFPNNEPSRTNP